MVIYTRNASCTPIRAEEGITGALCPPNSSVPFRDLPEEQQIGGYPTSEQLARATSGLEGSCLEEEDDEEPTLDTGIDAPTLDSEGRCVLLEFPAFVLIGVYCPAYRDESRDSFRMDFLNALDARVRNLVSMGKRVIVTGDINIARGAIDAAHATEAIRKGQKSEEEYISHPSRRLFNQLLSDGVVVGQREQGREQPVLHDVCRAFHPGRVGMYTCWEQRINARPGNYGARIDYLLCSLNMQDWFADSNIQEGLMVRILLLDLIILYYCGFAVAIIANRYAQGSDHCPVYATFHDCVPQGGSRVHIRDIMNPPGMFKDGERKQTYTTKCLLPGSSRLLPEFDVDKRRSIKDMFARKPLSTLSMAASSGSTLEKAAVQETDSPTARTSTPSETTTAPPMSNTENDQSIKSVSRKRSQPAPTMSAKRSKSVTSTSSGSGQKTLKGFFKPKNVEDGGTQSPTKNSVSVAADSNQTLSASPGKSGTTSEDRLATRALRKSQSQPNVTAVEEHKDFVQPSTQSQSKNSETIIDPIVSKEDWSKLFTKKPVPRCDGHQEPCISLTTKKPGINCGRAFWICPRPLGPSGNKEKGTQWRCPTFIWASDWNPSTQSLHGHD